MTLFDWYIITRTKHLGIEDIKKGKHVESGPFDRASVKKADRPNPRKQTRTARTSPLCHKLQTRGNKKKEKEKRMDK